MKATSLEESMNFFLENSEGSIECEREDGAIAICRCYPEAVQFFESNEEK